ncbi:hypothetical protein MCOR32_011728 [Pyricularia oryzae]|nr:hypothetical protein MCOR32_011728 [Pyricularia oryzae]
MNSSWHRMELNRTELMLFKNPGRSWRIDLRGNMMPGMTRGATPGSQWAL